MKSNLIFSIGIAILAIINVAHAAKIKKSSILLDTKAVPSSKANEKVDIIGIFSDQELLRKSKDITKSITIEKTNGKDTTTTHSTNDDVHLLNLQGAINPDGSLNILEQGEGDAPVEYSLIKGFEQAKTNEGSLRNNLKQTRVISNFYQ